MQQHENINAGELEKSLDGITRQSSDIQAIINLFFYYLHALDRFAV